MAIPQPQKCNKTFEEHQVDYTPPNWKTTKPSRYYSQMSPLSILSQSDESIFSFLSQSEDSEILEASISKRLDVNKLEGTDVGHLNTQDLVQSDVQDDGHLERCQDVGKQDGQDLEQSDDADDDNIDTAPSTESDESVSHHVTPCQITPSTDTTESECSKEEAMEVEETLYHLGHVGRFFIYILCYIMSCHIMSRHGMTYQVMSRLCCISHITSHHVTSRHVTSRHITSRHVTSCHVMSRHVMSCM